RHKITAKMPSTAAVTRGHLENKLALAKRCSRGDLLIFMHVGLVFVTELLILQLASVRMLPWAKANLNPTG
uniref:Uncharacterized protein n=1 Tax=Aegilops tauschii subsp. strangulata TaxID=200361 RepID=A0A453G3G8_AEGTS